MAVENTSFLYVEDDPNSRQVMELLLTKAMNVGNLIIFKDSIDFESRLQALKIIPNIVLLDIHVEPYDGFEMLAVIREMPEFKNAKVIALTASVMNEEVEMIRAKGFDGTISKPLSIATFPELIHRIVAGESVWYIT